MNKYLRYHKKMIAAMRGIIAEAIVDGGFDTYMSLEDLFNVGSDDEIADIIKEEAEKAGVKLKYGHYLRNGY